MAPSPEYDKEPKAPDKSVLCSATEETKITLYHDNEQQSNPDSKTSITSTSSETEDNRHVGALDDGQLRALLDEAITYKCPKDREGKSSLFKVLLDQVEDQDEQACEAATRSWRGNARAAGASNSMQDLVAAALAAEPAPRRPRQHGARDHGNVSARTHHGGSLPSGVDTSFLLGEEVGRGMPGYVATVRCVNPSPLTERRVSASDAADDHTARRSKPPPAPVTYTARATLEIGSRSLAAAAAAAQVRTSPRPAAAAATPQDRLMGAITRHIQHHDKPIVTNNDNQQQRSADNIEHKSNTSSGNTLLVTLSVNSATPEVQGDVNCFHQTHVQKCLVPDNETTEVNGSETIEKNDTILSNENVAEGVKEIKVIKSSVEKSKKKCNKDTNNVSECVKTSRQKMKLPHDSQSKAAKDNKTGIMKKCFGKSKSMLLDLSIRQSGNEYYDENRLSEDDEIHARYRKIFREKFTKELDPRAEYPKNKTLHDNSQETVKNSFTYANLKKGSFTTVAHISNIRNSFDSSYSVKKTRADIRRGSPIKTEICSKVTNAINNSNNTKTFINAPSPSDYDRRTPNAKQTAIGFNTRGSEPNVRDMSEMSFSRPVSEIHETTGPPELRISRNQLPKTKQRMSNYVGTCYDDYFYRTYIATSSYTRPLHVSRWRPMATEQPSIATTSERLSEGEEHELDTCPSVSSITTRTDSDTDSLDDSFSRQRKHNLSVFHESYINPRNVRPMTIGNAVANEYVSDNEYPIAENVHVIDKEQSNTRHDGDNNCADNSMIEKCVAIDSVDVERQIVSDWVITNSDELANDDKFEKPNICNQTHLDEDTDIDKGNIDNLIEENDVIIDSVNTERQIVSDLVKGHCGELSNIDKFEKPNIFNLTPLNKNTEMKTDSEDNLKKENAVIVDSVDIEKQVVSDCGKGNSDELANVDDKREKPNICEGTHLDKDTEFTILDDNNNSNNTEERNEDMEVPLKEDKTEDMSARSFIHNFQQDLSESECYQQELVDMSSSCTKPSDVTNEYMTSQMEFLKILGLNEMASVVKKSEPEIKQTELSESSAQYFARQMELMNALELDVSEKPQSPDGSSHSRVVKNNTKIEAIGLETKKINASGKSAKKSRKSKKKSKCEVRSAPLKSTTAVGERGEQVLTIPSNSFVVLPLFKRLLPHPSNTDNNNINLQLQNIEPSPNDTETNQTIEKKHVDNTPEVIDIDQKAFRMFWVESIMKGGLADQLRIVKPSSADKVDSGIAFSCVTTPEVVSSCNATSSAAQSAVAVDAKKSIDENGNSVQGFSSPQSGSSQQKKQRRKKTSKNETVIKSDQIDGYQGNKDLDEVLQFIESNAEQTRSHNKLRGKHHDDDKGKKRSSERRAKDKERSVKRASSLEEVSRTSLRELTSAAEPAERRSWADPFDDHPKDKKKGKPKSDAPPPEPHSDTALELLDFQTVTKKKKPRKRAEEGARDEPRAASPERRRQSAPPSDKSNDSNDDLDSVHSLPGDAAAAAGPRAPASYADIARTPHNIPDLIESCNYYGEGEPPPPPAYDDTYPALEARRRKPPPPPPRARRPDLVAEPARRPPVVLLAGDEAAPRDLHGVTFGFDVNEQLLGGGDTPRRCDLVASTLPVRAGLRYLPPPAPPTHNTIVDYVGHAWEDIVKCGGKAVYFTE